MKRLSVFSDSRFRSEALNRHLGGLFEIQMLGLDRISELRPDHDILVDINLRDTARLLDLKEWLKDRPKNGKVIFVTDKDSRIEIARAYALGATEVMPRPLDARALLRILQGEFESLAGTQSGFSAKEGPGAAAAFGGLQSIFSAAVLGEKVNPTAVNSAGAAVVAEIESQGLSAWIDTVRKHHSQTYQHCLLVTGLVVGFGQHLGLPQTDRHRLSFAGILHDVGKARIPIAILEKPGPLDQEEMTVMRQHPQFGLEALENTAGLDPEMIDMVVHHHEYLDGSGYPHGLCAGEISDLVRMITIADVFGALIERRSYKPPLTGETAYQILLDMGPKLDKDLVREFGFAAQAGKSAA